MTPQGVFDYKYTAFIIVNDQLETAEDIHHTVDLSSLRSIPIPQTDDYITGRISKTMAQKIKAKTCCFRLHQQMIDPPRAGTEDYKLYCPNTSDAPCDFIRDARRSTPSFGLTRSEEKARPTLESGTPPTRPPLLIPTNMCTETRSRGRATGPQAVRGAANDQGLADGLPDDGRGQVPQAHLSRGRLPDRMLSLPPRKPSGDGAKHRMRVLGAPRRTGALSLCPRHLPLQEPQGRPLKMHMGVPSGAPHPPL